MTRLGSAILAAALAAAIPSTTRAVEKWQTFPTPPAMPTPRQSGYAPVNGISMFYDVYGKGSPILLIHIGLGNADQWAAEIPALSRRHTVIVADTRGHGRSTRTPAPLTYDHLAEDYLALLDYLHFQRVALVGVSDGAIIGLDIAIKHPERLSKLFAQGANATVDGARDKALDPAASKLAGPALDADYKRLSATPEQLADFRKALARMWENEPDFSARELTSIKVPIAIVIADHDEWIKEDHARYLARTIPGSQTIVLKNVSHYAALQDPGAYAKAVLRFIDGR